MSVNREVDRLRGLVVRVQELVEAGHSRHRLYRAVEQGMWVRLCRGRYVAQEDWAACSAPERHALRVLAVDDRALTSPVFSHWSAAVLHGLPALRFDGDSVHTLVPPESAARSSGLLVRHRVPHSSEEIVEIGGLRCTDLARTAFDVARSARFDAGLVCADAALRRLASPCGGAVSGATLHDFGVASPSGRARRVFRFASALAESPLESLTRLQLARSGFEVREQVRVRAPGGGDYRMDFELLGCGAFLEADGAMKVADERFRAGLSAEQVVLREKEREDWVRGTTGKRVVRCRWADVQSADRLSRRLAQFGVRPPAPASAARRAELA